MSRTATKAQLAHRAKIHAAAIEAKERAKVIERAKELGCLLPGYGGAPEGHALILRLAPGRPRMADKKVVLSMRLTPAHKAEMRRRKASGELVAWLEPAAEPVGGPFGNAEREIVIAVLSDPLVPESNRYGAAIKRLRNATGATLIQAKNFVDRVRGPRLEGEQ